MITRRKNTKTETQAQQGPRSHLILGRQQIQSIVSASSYSRTAFLSLVFLPLVIVLTLTFMEFQQQMTSLIPATAAKKQNTTNTNTEQRLVDLHDELNTIIQNRTSPDEIRHANTKNSLLVQHVARTSELNNDKNSMSVLSYTSNNNNNNDTSSSSVSSSSSSTMTRALDCLRQTRPVPHDLPYPEDAYKHFQEIHQRLSQWTQQTNHKPHRAAGYQGPWIENHWITHFQHKLLEHSSHNKNNKKKKKNNTTTLSEIFGPYIPIFIPWTDIWVRNRHNYPKALVRTLLEEDFFRDDVMYITVNQNDAGFPGRCSELENLQRNKLFTILSAGGYGHVPIPLLKQPEPLLAHKPSPSARPHLLSYVGSQKNAPHNMRQKMIAQGHHYYYGEQWRDEMVQSKFQLCPRGFGRTSYHVQVCESVDGVFVLWLLLLLLFCVYFQQCLSRRAFHAMDNFTFVLFSQLPLLLSLSLSLSLSFSLSSFVCLLDGCGDEIK